jgi:hypothetical protein
MPDDSDNVGAAGPSASQSPPGLDGSKMVDSGVEPLMPDIPPDGVTAVLSARSQIVRAVHSPLGFFVLALLIVEAFLWGSGTWFGLSEPWRIAAIGVGVLLFLIVFGTVVWLVIAYPQNLVFSEESHVQFAALQMFGNESHLITGRALEALPPQRAPAPPPGQLPAPLPGQLPGGPRN